MGRNLHGSKKRKKKTGKGKLKIGQYMTRRQALSKLQISLRVFRRLCILKGIYPRVAPTRVSKKKGKNKSYYLSNDIRFLMHEPLLDELRKYVSHMKRVTRARGRRQFGRIKMLLENRPHYTLDHLVVERYPSFQDAMRDLDDALCTVFLYRHLPTEKKVVPEVMRRMCNEMALQFQMYVIMTRSLRKTFISIKGYYFQAEILGFPLTWLEPHNFPQTLPRDVDYSAMRTFLEFYLQLLGFVLYKLYDSIGLRYPPQFNAKALSDGDLLSALEISKKDGGDGGNGTVDVAKSITKRLDSLFNSATPNPDFLKTENVQQPDADLDDKKDESESDESSLDDDDDDDDDSDEEYDEDEDDEDDDEDDEEEDEVDMPEIDGSAEVSEEDDDEEEEEEEEEEKKTKKVSAGLPTTSVESAVAEGQFFTEQELEDKVKREEDEEEQRQIKNLFKFCHMWVGRECPVRVIEFVVTACGGEVSHAGGSDELTEKSPLITHHITDRPLAAEDRQLNRVYVQPQWLFDSINFRCLLPTDEYAPGHRLPDHLSPFVDDEQEGYVPKRREQLNKIVAGIRNRDASGFKAEAESDDSEVDERAEMEAQYERELQAEHAIAETGTAEVVAEEAEEDELAVARRKGLRRIERKRKAIRSTIEDENRAAMMMSRKKRTQYQTLRRVEVLQKHRGLDLEKRRLELEEKAAQKGSHEAADAVTLSEPPAARKKRRHISRK